MATLRTTVFNVPSCAVRQILSRSYVVQFLMNTFLSETVLLFCFLKLSCQNAFVLTGSNIESLPYFQPVDTFNTKSPRIRCVISSCSFQPHPICSEFSKSFPYKKIINQNLTQSIQELRSILRDLISELLLRQKHHTHMGPIGNGSGVMSF